MAGKLAEGGQDEDEPAASRPGCSVKKAKKACPARDSQLPQPDLTRPSESQDRTYLTCDLARSLLRRPFWLLANSVRLDCTVANG